MSGKFIAIGVGQGDAFFLQRGDFALLVDGGRSVDGFAVQFQRVVKRSSVDVLVCTHNDSDHANGILGFLESGLKCREIWLPGSWTDRLEDLLLKSDEFFFELVKDIGELHERPRSLSALGDWYAEIIQDEGVSYEEASADELAEAIETASEIEGGYRGYPWPRGFPWTRYHLELRPRLYKWWREDWRIQLLFEAIAAGERIRRIALAAYHSGALIRWFEFASEGRRGGIPDRLVPVNAREVAIVLRKRWKALRYFALTTSNKRSLVFYSPGLNNEPAVLFTADSDLGFSQSIQWHPDMIITAPHHGSESNAEAYRRFQKEAQGVSAIWVRSDGRFKTRPGSSYLQVPGTRFCTLCRGGVNPKQDLRFTLHRCQWKPVATRKCCCQ